MLKASSYLMIKRIPSTSRQANTILERVHQIISNILLTFKVQNVVLDGKNILGGILASTIFTLWATVHMITQYTPTQLIFGHKSIVN